MILSNPIPAERINLASHSFPQNQDTPDEEAQLHNRGHDGDCIEIAIDKGRDARQDEQPEDDKYSTDVGIFVLHCVLALYASSS